MDDETKARLFRKFEQADGSFARRFGGTGLGLAISRQLTELMGGAIGAADRAGGGSVFWMELSLPRATNPVDADVGPGRLKGVRLLVVDDLAINRTIFTHQLAPLGIHVEEAESARAAFLSMADAERRGTPFDIVLVDQVMPEMPGEDLAEHIRAETGWRQPKLILASSVGVPTREAKAARVGFDAFLTKPVRHSTLVGCLNRVLSGETLEASYEALPVTRKAEIRGRILLAEDNAINQEIARTILVEAGHEVVIAADGRQAVDACRLQHFDLVLMDVQMPVVDGLQATREIRRQEGGGRRTPIVAMTANAMRGDQEACLAAGMDDYVSKPFDPAQVLESVARWLATPDSQAGPSAGGVAQELPVLELGVVDKLAQMMAPSRFNTLVAAYLDHGRVQIARLGALAGAADLDGLMHEAHEIHGMAGNFGARRLQQLAEDLETAGALNDWQRAEALADRIPAVAEETWQALDARFAALQLEREPEGTFT
jgi:CheY-like chemotaxis protein/HPt (histidine-containing phosphotransfer) domain-containing protein